MYIVYAALRYMTCFSHMTCFSSAAGKRVIIRDRVAVIHEVMKEFGSKFVYEILPGMRP